MKRLTSLLILFAALAVSVSPTRTQTRVAVPQTLTARAAAGETVSVVVGTTAPFRMAGDLAGPAAVASARVAMRQAVADVSARAAAMGMDDVVRYDHLPFFAGRVSRAALEALAAMPGVRSIEENVLLKAGLAQSVPLVNAPTAWSAGSTGSGWKVAVLDTGVDASHPFLAGKVSDQACYSGGAGGESVCPGNSDTSGGGPCAVSGCNHGTHVAGIAAGASSAGNGTAPGARVIAMQVFTQFNDANICEGVTPCARVWYSDLLLGLNRVIALAGTGNAYQIAAVNLSLGGDLYTDQSVCDAYHPGIRTAVESLRSLGIATVASSMNDGNTSAIGFPACLTSAISVGSTLDAQPFRVSSFSNNAPFLSLYAPGSNIQSSVPGGGYAVMNGTSMAAPHVAGAWAILKQAVPSASVANVLAALTSTGVPVEDKQRSPNGATHPFIRISNARLQLLSGVTPPGVTTGFTATVDGNIVSMSWNPATNATGYQVLARYTNGGPLIASVPLNNQLSVAVNAPNGAYVVSVRATNSNGAGAESNQVSINVPVLPPPPGNVTNLVSTVVGTAVSFTWDAPASGGPIASYVLQAGLTPAFTTPILATMLPVNPRNFAVGGVAPGTYYVRVYAQNAGGASPQFSNEETVVIVGPQPPGTPTMNTPTVLNGVASLSWTPGSGPAATSYQLVVTGSASLAATFTGTSTSVRNVPPGTYYLIIRAINAAGTSAFSNQVTLTVPTP